MGMDMYLLREQHEKDKECDFCLNVNKHDIKCITFNNGPFYACPDCYEHKDNKQELWSRHSEKIKGYKGGFIDLAIIDKK
jgi:hypothetical protein